MVFIDFYPTMIDISKSQNPKFSFKFWEWKMNALYRLRGNIVDTFPSLMVFIDFYPTMIDISKSQNPKFSFKFWEWKMNALYRLRGNIVVSLTMWICELLSS